MKLTPDGEWAVTPDVLEHTLSCGPIKLECSLQEWVDSLPVGHRARVELHILQKVQLDSRRKFLEDATIRLRSAMVCDTELDYHTEHRTQSAVAYALKLWEELQKSA